MSEFILKEISEFLSNYSKWLQENEQNDNDVGLLNSYDKYLESLSIKQNNYKNKYQKGEKEYD